MGEGWIPQVLWVVDPFLQKSLLRETGNVDVKVKHPDGMRQKKYDLSIT